MCSFYPEKISSYLLLIAITAASFCKTSARRKYDLALSSGRNLCCQLKASIFYNPAASDISGIVTRGASLQDVHVIAGKGTAMEIRDWKRLYSLYGGDPRQWEKKTGIAETDIFRYELHWYEKNGKMPVSLCSL